MAAVDTEVTLGQVVDCQTQVSLVVLLLDRHLVLAAADVDRVRPERPKVERQRVGLDVTVETDVRTQRSTVAGS